MFCPKRCVDCGTVGNGHPPTAVAHLPTVNAESRLHAHAHGTDGRLRLHLVTSLPTHCIASRRIAAVGVLTLSYRSSGVEPRASTAPAALACEPLLSAAIGAALSIVTAVGAAIDAPVRKVPIDSMLRSYQYKTSHGTCNATCSVPPAHLRANCRHRPTGRRRAFTRR